MFIPRKLGVASERNFRAYIKPARLLRECVSHGDRNCHGAAAETFKSRMSFEIPEGKLECDTINGVHVISEYKKKSRVTTIGCVLPAGAMFEEPEERGSALFLEHVLFQRTTQRDQRRIEEELQEIGGSATATATRDMFVFYGTAPSQNAGKLAELLIDVAVNGVTCSADVAAAKSRILNELVKIDSDPERVVMDYLSSVAYQDTALSKSTFPESHIIKNFDANCLARFRERVFQPRFVTLISSGALSFDELRTLVSKRVAEQETAESTCYPEFKQLRFSGADLRLRDDDEEVGYVAIGFEGPTFSQCEDRYAFEVAKEIVGSWDMTYGGANHNAPYLAHSAFNSDVCRSYKSFILDYACNSVWGCYFVCDKMKLSTMVGMLLGEWRRLYTTVADAEVKRAVNKCKFRQLATLSDPVDRFLDIVNCLHLRNCYVPVRERLAMYEEITADTVRDAAAKYIYDQSPAVAALGRIENLTDYSAIYRGTYSFFY